MIVTCAVCVSEPLVPFTVSTYWPTPAFWFGLIFNVLVPLPVTELGPNDDDVRVGNPVTENVTVPVKPLILPTVTVKLVEERRRTVCELGVTLNEKSAAAVVTTRVTVVVCVIVPSEPVTVSVYDPPGVVLSVFTVSVEFPEPATDVGLNDAVAPVGKPETLNETVPVYPFTGDTFAE